MNDEKLLASVRNWLDKQGYPLEMRVAAAFQAARYFTIQGDVYADPATGKLREIDVLAQWLNGRDDLAYALLVHAVAECKSGSKPWVLFSGVQPRPRDAVDLALARIGNGTGNKLLAALAEGGTETNLVKASVRTGHAFTQAFRGSEGDAAFAAVTGSISAAHGIVAEFERGGATTVIAHIVVPTVVVDAPVIECHLGEDGDVRLEQIQEADLFWPAGGARATVVRILHESQVGTYAEALHADLTALFAKLPSKDALGGWRPAVDD
jgi:hypothetical protein